jgi:hypothetical protein
MLNPCSLDDDDDELEGIWQAALEGAQQSKRPDAVRSADLSALVGQGSGSWVLSPRSPTGALLPVGTRAHAAPCTGLGACSGAVQWAHDHMRHGC